MGVISFLKSLSNDVGQGNKRFETRGRPIVLSLIPQKRRGNAFLDIGCREGVQSDLFKSWGLEVTSVDTASNYERVSLIDCNRNLLYQDRTFDIIWCSEVLEHLVDPIFPLKKARRVLRPGGKLIYSTPNSFPFYFCLLAAVGLTPQFIQREIHLHFFDFSFIKRLFSEGRFFGFLPFTFFRFRLRRFIGLLSPTFIIEEVKT